MHWLWALSSLRARASHGADQGKLVPLMEEKLGRGKSGALWNLGRENGLVLYNICGC